MGSCGKESEDILLLHLQGSKGSGHCGSFPLSHDGNQEQRRMNLSLGGTESLNYIAFLEAMLMALIHNQEMNVNYLENVGYK